MSSLPLELIRPRDVRAVVGLSRSRVYELVQAGQFPKPIRLSERAVGWRRADLDAWLAAREAASKPAA